MIPLADAESVVADLVRTRDTVKAAIKAICSLYGLPLPEGLVADKSGDTLPRYVIRKCDQIVALLDRNPGRAFPHKLIARELNLKVDRTMMCRLKREGRIARAEFGGYCSVESPLAKVKTGPILA